MIKKGLILFLTLIVSFSSLLACDNNIKNTDNTTIDVEIWTPVATRKIMRDRSYDMSGNKLLSYEMAKNETEGAQFIITPKNGYKNKSFDVSVSDLKSGENTISKDSIEIYLEKYVRIDQQINNNDAYGVGYQPDPLLPFDKAIEYKENTVIGVNQGVYITVETEENTPAGTYKGSCSIILDGKKEYTIPVQVLVWDFAISDTVHTRSLFDIWPSYLMEYELDASEEMYNTYREELLKYRLSSTTFWNEGYSNMDDMIAGFIENAKVATQDVRVSAYDIPTPYFEGYSNDNTKNRVKLFYEMAKASTPDCCLFDKVVLYFGCITDEAWLSPTRYVAVNPCAQSIQDSKEQTIEKLESEGFFDTLSEEYATYLKEKILKIPNILTSDYDEYFLDGLQTYCPLFDRFNSEEAREIYQEQKAKNGEVWWYGCTGPCYPNVTYHLDDHLLGARVLNWMQYAYNIDGNLYWCVNYYDSKKLESLYEAENPDDMNGDGHLFYSGVDYGINGPVGSMRLQTIRDGCEDYEYLYQLEQLTKGLSSYYSIDVSARSMLQPLFNKIFTNNKYVVDDNNFYNVRSEIADIIYRCSGDEKFVLADLSYVKDEAIAEFYVAAGCEVKVNNQTIIGTSQGEGYKYTAKIKTDKDNNIFNIEIIKDGNTKNYQIDAGGKSFVLATFENEKEVEAFAGNEYKGSSDHISIIKDVINNDDSAKIIINSTFDPNDTSVANMTYRPEVSLDITNPNINMSMDGLSSIKISLYNATGSEIKVSVLLSAMGIEYEFVNKKLAVGANTISLDAIDKSTFKQLKNVDSIILRFNNSIDSKSEQAMPQQVIYINEIIVSYVAGR